MLTFPNAKINIGLRITSRRPDGYHNLETVFVPVGLYAGTPQNPVSFCDCLEITEAPVSGSFTLGGRPMDCPPEKNLVYKALALFCKKWGNKSVSDFNVSLIKNLPDGAGLGGGSADAAFTLRMLNDLNSRPFSDDRLEEMALSLGADCPVFIRNRACYAEGVGEKMSPVELDLSGWWCLIVKPPVSISTKEAFSGVVPREAPERFPLWRIGEIPVSDWKEVAVNDFEQSLFPLYPELASIKNRLYSLGAAYASMSGSGSALFGLFPDKDTCLRAAGGFETPLQTYPLLL